MTDAERDARAMVLCAFDGSPAAATALPAACAIAEQIGAGVEVLHVSADGLPAEDLRRHLPTIEGSPHVVRIRVEHGSPAERILACAAEPAVALVVLTTHGRRIEPGRHLGHVTEAVVAAAVRPILLVRPEAAVTTPERDQHLRRLLVPVDGSPTTAAALKPIAEFAQRLGASLDLLYVSVDGDHPPGELGSIKPPRYVDQPQHEWPAWTREVIERLCRFCADCPPEVPARMFLATGDAAREIVRFAAEHAEDAIVLVRRSHLEPGRAHVLRGVLDAAPCPILLVGEPLP